MPVRGVGLLCVSNSPVNIDMQQNTLLHTVSRSGKGLHTGLTLTATLCPAQPNTGVRICRTDLPNRPTYEALAQYVGATTRGTVLEQGTWRVSTVEHLLAALYACGITNCLIEVNGPEVPILDGSAAVWMEAISEAGVQAQDAEARTFIVTEPMTFDNGHGSTMTLLPSDQYEVEVHIDFPSLVLGKQTAILTDLTRFGDQIASARTFCFLREIQPLLSLGLIKGGDLSNAIVIYDKRIWQWRMNRLARRLNQPQIDASQLGYLTPLQWDNEPARHKLLDVIGDLSLLGCRIQGKVIVTRPGHGFNTFCARQIINLNPRFFDPSTPRFLESSNPRKIEKK